MRAKGDLFGGVVVVIDDDADNSSSNIAKIIDQIDKAHCPVIKFTKLPSDKVLNNLRAASFFVVDWNLHGGALDSLAPGEHLQVPSTLKASERKDILDFLTALKAIKFSPIFIFTDAPVDEVKQILKEKKIITGEDNDHVFVMAKKAVVSRGLTQVLATWIKKVPSAYILKHWEKEYERAKNELFIDFYTNSPLWPLIFWNSYRADGIEPSHEIGRMIGRNLASRVSNLDCNLAPAAGKYSEELSGVSDEHRTLLKKVLEGERFIPASRLAKHSIAPGDIFKKGGDYYINIRPDCDCIPRGSAKLDSVKLYLLKGQRLTANNESKAFRAGFGLFEERGFEAIMFAVDDGQTIAFKLKEITVQSWRSWKGRRVGRLIGPHLTGLQQRFAGYLQRPGTSRIPTQAVRALAETQP